MATSETNHRPTHQLQTIRPNGHNFDPLGEVIQGMAFRRLTA
ncbi:MAG TPA: hypothetical protein VJY39_05955 [Acidisphaera sp.]|nr:hypothetical protein [Acidisphaera sp.]